MTPALARFETEFRRWVAAHNATHRYTTNAEALLTSLRSQVPDELLTHIGSAYVNGWLQTETEPDRGYFVRETDRPGLRGGQFVIIHRGNGKVDPCWELFIQLADYAWLRTIASRYGQHVRLEDSLMDLTVRTDVVLVLYVEHKTTSQLAQSLLADMRRYGETGFGLDDPDKGNDPLRKAKYLVRANARPLYFGLSAIGTKRLFRVEYLDNNRFQLYEENRGFASVLTEHPGVTNAAQTWPSVDALAIEVLQQCPELWVSVGSGQTAYNFYLPGDKRDAILLGVHQNGEIWTDNGRLGAELAIRLSHCLSLLGVDLAADKDWCFWKKGDRKLSADDIDPVQIAQACRNALREYSIGSSA